ncbi:response regulator [Viridibacillus sp. NPDC096237]|uniref:response regulator n=1 Tax=Viridibacillus sp. NPDC096237 TaxID=3390721 RepID=UPI003D01D8D7
MSFKKRQIIGFGLILLFLIIMLSTMIFTLNKLKTDMTEIVEDRYYKVQTVMEIRQLFSRSDREILYAAIDAKKSDINSSLQTISDNQAAISVNIIKLSTIANQTTSQQLLKKLDKQYSSYTDTETKIIQQIKANSLQGNLKELMQEQRSKRIEVLSTLDEFKVYQEGLMNDTLKNSQQRYSDMIKFTLFAVVFSILIISLILLWMIRSTSSELQSITKVIKKIDFKNLSAIPRIHIKMKDEIGEIAHSFNEMAGSLEDYNRKEKDFTKKISEQNWVQTGLAEIATMYQRIVDVEELGERLITRLAPMVDASFGVFYIRREQREDTHFVKMASYAGEGIVAGRNEFQIGEGLIGQCAIEKKSYIITDIPDNYQLITTGLGEVNPKSIIIMPVIFEDEVVGILEMASLEQFTNLQQNFLQRVLETLGITINSVQVRMEIERLLKESQAQTEELQAQSEELQSQSEELQAQSEELQSQAEELRMINEQLSERTHDAEEKSRELEEAKINLEEHAEELQKSSKYKSEFMANVSHELRTPLNSILILSEMLETPDDNTLAEEQQEFARIIHSSGQDLLKLINDILDLSKVEVGKLKIQFDEMNMSEVPELLHQNFDHVALKKGLTFNVEKDSNVPDIVFTDQQRLQQILKNLLSNAFKFTYKGAISVHIKIAEKERINKLVHTEITDEWVEISVKDTGIGISKEKQRLIFEAFQQGDGATERKYGGTGLGLSISREFAKLLGGWVFVKSEEGKGSIFTLLIPNLPNGIDVPLAEEVDSSVLTAVTDENEVPEKIKPDQLMYERQQLTQASKNMLSNKTILIVDDDHRNIFALKNALESQGMKIISVENGFECLEILKEKNTVNVVLMDIMMPVMDGYETMRNIRSQEIYQNLPIIALTAKAMKGDREKCLKAGASDYISKPLKIDQLLSVLRVWLAK